MKIIIPIISLFILTNIYADDVDSIVKIKNPETFYVGSGMNLTTSNRTEGIDAFSLTAGYVFNQYIGLETRYMKNVISNNIFVDDISFFLKPQYSMYNFNLYSLLGYGKLKLEDNYYTSNKYDFKWGIGVEYKLDEIVSLPVNVFVDYTDITTGSEKKFNLKENDVNTVNFGFTYKF